MEQDKDIEYQSKLMELKSLINKIKQIDIDTTRLEQEVALIAQEVDKTIDEHYQNFDSIPNHSFLTDTLMTTYSNATSKLEKRIDLLKSEYNEYYAIYHTSLELESNLNTVTSDTISYLIEEAKQLMKRMNATSQKDYDLEKNIVEKVYSVVYKILKLEMIYSSSTNLLESIKSNPIDTSYICKYIYQDIDSLLETSPEYQEIYQQLLKINKNGIDDSLYLDKTLISLLTLANNKELVQEGTNSFLEQCNTITKTTSQLEQVMQEQENTKLIKENLTIKKKELFQKKIKKNLFYLGNLLTLMAASFGIDKEMKKSHSDITYRTTIETYDSREDIPQVNEYYLPKSEDSTIITKYLPWKETGFFKTEYTREIATYDITGLDIDYENIEDYLTNEFLQQLTPGYQMDRSVEKLKKVSAEEKNSETYYTIERTNQSLEDYHIDFDQERYEEETKTCITALVFLDLLLILGTFPNHSKLKRSYKKTKKELKETKQLLLEQRDTFNQLLNEYQILKQDLLQEYDKLPTALHEHEEIKKKVKKLKQTEIPLDNKK